MLRKATVITAALAVEWMATAFLSPALHAAESAQRKPGPRKVVVGTLMYNMFHEYPGLERRLEELGHFIDQMAAQAKSQYPGRQLDIAALPENAVNGNAKGSAAEVSLRLEGPVLEAMGAKARQHRCYVVVPLYLVDDRKKDLYYNAVVLLDRQGKAVGTYRKVFPVAGRNEDILEGGVTPGNTFPVFDCDFGRVGFQICFDISFDEGWEALGRKGAELVIWPTQSPGQIKPAFLRHAQQLLCSHEHLAKQRFATGSNGSQNSRNHRSRWHLRRADRSRLRPAHLATNTEGWEGLHREVRRPSWVSLFEGRG